MSRIDDEALDWVMRQAGGKMDAAESAAFDAWFTAHPRHQGAYLRASAIQHSVDQLTVQESMRPGAAARLDAPEEMSRPSLHRRRAVMFGGALAAGLALAVFALQPALQPAGVEPIAFSTAQGEFRKVPLADRSTISLNSASEVEVVYSGAERRIVLARGEAWFEVAKDKSKPFVVESADVRVRAVGTAFAVRRHPGGADVLVTEGVVEVWSEGGTAHRQQLAAGAQAFVPRNASMIRSWRDLDDIERKLAWRSGKLVFQNRLLSDAVADFNRYNTRQLVIADPALARKTLVGQYRIDQPELFANDVRALFRTEVALGPDRITLGTPAAGRGAARP